MTTPLLSYSLFHRAEEWLTEGPSVSWWVVVASTVLAVVTGVRCSTDTVVGPVRYRMLVTVVAGTVVAGAYLTLGFVIYRWLFPVARPVGAELLLGLPAGALGAWVGYVLGRRRPRRPRAWRRYLVGGVVVAVFGAMLAPSTAERGADFSVADFPYGSDELAAGEPAAFTLPGGGHFGIYAIGSSPTRPDCRIGGRDGVTAKASLIPVQPQVPGFDATPSYRWIAEFDAATAGGYTLTCSGGQADSLYSVGGVPEFRGAAGALVHWPVPVLLLLGAVPGLLAVAGGVAGRRRASSQSRRKPVGKRTIDAVAAKRLGR